jgi:hypothetical protein
MLCYTVNKTVKNYISDRFHYSVWEVSRVNCEDTENYFYIERGWGGISVSLGLYYGLRRTWPQE